jgi:hypothetical protein
VPTSYIHSEDEAQFVMPEPGQVTTDARRRKPKGQGQVFPQPVSISLNKE